MPNLYGTNINQISFNGMLGNLAFQDKAYVNVDRIGIGSTFIDSGTSTQILQVYGGGAYISGSVGVGTTNPISQLHLSSGPVVVNSTSLTGTSSQNLQVTGGAYISGSVGVGTTNPTSSLFVVGNTLTTGIATIGLGATSTPPSNSQFSFELTSNTNLRVKVRGTDGVLRSANLTLA